MSETVAMLQQKLDAMPKTTEEMVERCRQKGMNLNHDRAEKKLLRDRAYLQLLILQKQYVEDVEAEILKIRKAMAAKYESQIKTAGENFEIADKHYNEG